MYQFRHNRHPILIHCYSQIMDHNEHRYVNLSNITLEIINTNLDATIEFLKTHDSPTKLRFLSNQILHERDASHIPAANHDAGGQILFHIRGLGIHAPVLIYTTRSDIASTRYVEQYDMAGSLGGNYNIFHNYVVALGKGTADDGKWMKFDA